MKNNTKLKGITFIRVDSVELDSSAEVAEVISGNEAGTKVFGFLAKAIVKTMKVLAPHFGLSVTEAKPEAAVETETEVKPETKSEVKPEAKPESKVKAAFNPNPQEFNYSEVFDSKVDTKKRKHNKNDVDDALHELRKFKEELRKKYKF